MIFDPIKLAAIASIFSLMLLLPACATKPAVTNANMTNTASQGSDGNSGSKLLEAAVAEKTHVRIKQNIPELQLSKKCIFFFTSPCEISYRTSLVDRKLYPHLDTWLEIPDAMAKRTPNLKLAYRHAKYRLDDNVSFVYGTISENYKIGDEWELRELIPSVNGSTPSFNIETFQPDQDVEIILYADKKDATKETTERSVIDKKRVEVAPGSWSIRSGIIVTKAFSGGKTGREIEPVVQVMARPTGLRGKFVNLGFSVGLSPDSNPLDLFTLGVNFEIADVIDFSIGAAIIEQAGAKPEDEEVILSNYFGMTIDLRVIPELGSAMKDALLGALGAD